MNALFIIPIYIPYIIPLLKLKLRILKIRMSRALYGVNIFTYIYLIHGVKEDLTIVLIVSQSVDFSFAPGYVGSVCYE